MPFSTLFFDLDDTLYSNTNGLWGAIRERMNQFITERLGLPLEEVARLRSHYFETYGTTLRGLQTHHNVDAYEFLAYVHDLPLGAYLEADPELRALLLSLPQPKWILTNADANHARRVLGILGVTDCFTGILDIHALNYHCKPQVEAYQQAMTLVGEGDPRRCVLFDDSPRNLAPALELGFTTILVGTCEPNPAACRFLRSLKELPRVMPELWN